MFILIEFTITNWTRSENFEIFTDYDKSYSLCEIPVANRRFGQIAVPAFGVGQIFINPAKSIQDRVDLARDFSRKYRNRIRREKSGQIVAAAKLNGDWPNPFKIGARKHSKSGQIKGITGFRKKYFCEKSDVLSPETSVTPRDGFSGSKANF